MDRKLRETLEACIQAIESGEGDLEGCLRRYPEQAQHLRPQLELLFRLGSNQKAERRPQGMAVGQREVLAALSAMNAGRDERMFGILTPALAKAAAVVAAGVLLAGAAGASASLGGPDPGQVLDSVGIAGSDDDCVTAAASPSPEAAPSDDDECDHYDGDANGSDEGGADDADDNDSEDVDDGTADDVDDGDEQDEDDGDIDDEDGSIEDADDEALGDGADDDVDDGAADDVDDDAADGPEEDSAASPTDGS